MRFIDPKTDLAFKRIFGSEASKEILMSFLNAALYQGKTKIQDLEILDPYLVPRLKGMKDTFVDVQARLSDETTVIIEMQVLSVASFEKRILYNAAKKYSIQLGEGENYHLLKPIIALTITDFIMFPQIERLETRFILKEKHELIDYPANDIELVFLELPKFTKTLDDDLTILEKWLYFLRYAPRLEAVPDILRPDLEQAFALANRMNLSRMELDDLERKEMWIHDQRGIVSKALKDGLQKGLEEGLQKGLEEGLQKGLEEGLQKGLEQGLQKGLEQGLEQGLQKGLEQGLEQGLQKGIEKGIQKGIEEGELRKAAAIAQNLFDVLDDKTIALKTGLSIETIAQLRQKYVSP